MPYRFDIDGLRTIAVLFVVIFHAFPSIIPGGFVGVDIFFVISGYLIGGIVYKECSAKTFSFANFYTRRAMRIFPAMACVLCATLLYGYVVLLPQEFMLLGKHAFNAVVFLQNFLLRLEAGYFDLVSHQKPLLHLWSLSVEEQFYILFPLVTLLGWRYRKILFSIKIFAIIAGIVACILWSQGHRNTIFYLPFSRGWELLVGALLAYHHFLRRQKRMRITAVSAKPARNALWVLPLIGFALIAYAGFFFKGSDPFPSWRALLPVLGTAAFIHFGQGACASTHWSVRALSHPFMLSVGRLSYPLYLWHWPLLSFGFITQRHSAFDKTILLCASFVLAILTHHVLERPLQKYRHSQKHAVWLTLIMVIIGACALGIYQKKIHAHHDHVVASHIYHASQTWDFPNPKARAFKHKGHDFYQEVGAHHDEVLCVGDSNMQHYGPRVTELLSQNRSNTMTVTWATYGGIMPVPGFVSVDNPSGNGYVEAAIDYSQRSSVKRVVIAAQWAGYFGNADLSQKTFYQNRLRDMIKAFETRGIHVTVILCIPMHADLTPINMLKRHPFGTVRVTAPSLPIHEVVTDEKIHTDALLRSALDETHTQILDPLAFLPKHTDQSTLQLTVPSLYKEHCIYKDMTHFAADFVRRFMTSIDHLFLKNEVV